MSVQSKNNVVILGATGSIGKSSLDVVRRLKKEFQVVGLSVHQNIRELKKLIKEFKPMMVVVEDPASFHNLQKELKSWSQKPTILNHEGGLEILAASPDADFVMCGVVGARGLGPLLTAIRAGKTIGLANKESLIVAGDIVMSLVKKHRATLIPVDSEHAAIYHCLQGQNIQNVRRLILTASGGPFYRYEKDLDSISVEQALDHPTWKMGRKITIDSATLMNKGLEAIEAHHLFGMPMEKISIVIHPESIIHSLVEFNDGSMLAQLSNPDMRLPIQYALTYPHRKPSPVKPLQLETLSGLHFAKPNFIRFPCLKLALEAGKKGGTAPAVLSASNEVAVAAFLDHRISFLTIARVVQSVLKRHPVKNHPTLKDIYGADAWARTTAAKFISRGDFHL